MHNGFVKIKVNGKKCRLFLKKLMLNNICFTNYNKINSNEIILKISYDDYLKLIDTSSIYDINIIKYYGFVRYKILLKQNITFILSLILSFVFLYLISNICLSINVIHNSSEIRSLVKNELDIYDIKKLSFIPSFNNRKKIINNIIKDNKDKIEWMEIDRKGSKLIIKIAERKTNEKTENMKNRHIIAKKSGIIKKIIASQGEIVKKKNEYVTKGDIIISGDIIKDETIKGQVVSNGVVYAETWYKVNVEYPLYYKEVKYLDEVKNNYYISFLDNKFYLKSNYTSSYLEKRKDIIIEKIVPFSIGIEKQRKTKTIKEKLSKEDAIKKAEEIAEDKILKKLSKGEYIISKKTLNFDEINSKIIIDVFFKVYEDITDYKDVELPEDSYPKE